MSAERTILEFTIPRDLLEILRVVERIEAALAAEAYSDRDLFPIGTAVEEALVNATKHGNESDPDKRVFILCQMTAERCDVCITNEGDGFDPELYDMFDFKPFSTALPPDRHISLFRDFRTEVKYHGRGHVISLTKVREAPL
jgi:serine/threonine-protein kinase RsbW